MTPNQLIKHFKTQTAAAAALGLKQPTIANWKIKGKIPDVQQLRIHAITKGKLRPDQSVRRRFPAV